MPSFFFHFNDVFTRIHLMHIQAAQVAAPALRAAVALTLVERRISIPLVS